jgi:RsiW-degrading membrane proteinase PrsW (M82 family)
MITHTNIIYALLGGVLPALLWLAFWLREDAKRPEPKGVLLRTFLLGMLAVILVLPGQRYVNTLFPHTTFFVFVLWAALEEVFKLGAAYFGGLSSVAEDEPLDALVYMLTAALGFVALENTLFILGPLTGHDIIGGFITGNLRFIGASLLHIVSSGIIGGVLALTFGQPFAKRAPLLLLGIVGAILFHALFNVFISSGLDTHIFAAFVLVWAGIATLLLFFERVKRLRPRI